MSKVLKWLLGSGGQAEMEASPESATAGSHAGPVPATDDSFGEVILNAKEPVLVDFWAPWSGPCRVVAPIVEDLAEEYEGRAVIVKVSTDENVRVENRLGIRGIPTLIVFKEGQEVDRVVGFAPRDVIRQKLSAVLDSKHDGGRPEATGGLDAESR
jgi:thioredoxin 1